MCPMNINHVFINLVFRLFFQTLLQKNWKFVFNSYGRLNSHLLDSFFGFNRWQNMAPDAHWAIFSYKSSMPWILYKQHTSEQTENILSFNFEWILRDLRAHEFMNRFVSLYLICFQHVYSLSLKKQRMYMKMLLVLMGYMSCGEFWFVDSVCSAIICMR